MTMSNVVATLAVGVIARRTCFHTVCLDYANSRLTRRQHSALRWADNLSNCVNYRLRLNEMDAVGHIRHDDAHALLRLRRDAAQQFRPDLEIGALYIGGEWQIA